MTPGKAPGSLQDGRTPRRGYSGTPEGEIGSRGAKGASGSTPRNPDRGHDGRPLLCPDCGHIFHAASCPRSSNGPRLTLATGGER